MICLSKQGEMLSICFEKTLCDILSFEIFCKTGCSIFLLEVFFCEIRLLQSNLITGDFAKKKGNAYEGNSESRIQANVFADSGEKRGEIFGEKNRRFSPSNFQAKWPQKKPKNPPHFPRGTKQNSFTPRFWEWGAPRKAAHFVNGVRGNVMLELFLQSKGTSVTFFRISCDNVIVAIQLITCDFL